MRQLTPHQHDKFASYRHRVLIAAGLLLMTGCAQDKGQWPSLNPRPIEKQAAAANSVETTSAGNSAGLRPSVIDALARETVFERDITALDTRWQLQDKALQAAIDRARGAAANSELWSTAQLELTRLDQLGHQIADQRDRLDHVAGDLALAASDGGDVGPALARAGNLIARVQRLGDTHRATFAAANAALPH